MRDRKAAWSKCEIPATDDDGVVPLKRSRRSVQKRPHGGASTTTIGEGGIVHRSKIKHCTHKGCVRTARAGGVCYTHGSKRKVCNHDGCTLYAHQGGLCFKHGAKHTYYRRLGCTHKSVRGRVCQNKAGQNATCAATMHVPCMFSKGEPASSTGQSANQTCVPTRGVPTRSSRMDHAPSTEQSLKDATTLNVPTVLRREEPL